VLKKKKKELRMTPEFLATATEYLFPLTKNGKIEDLKGEQVFCFWICHI
jgi:hypothetical protein